MSDSEHNFASLDSHKEPLVASEDLRNTQMSRSQVKYATSLIDDDYYLRKQSVHDALPFLSKCRWFSLDKFSRLNPYPYNKSHKLSGLEGLSGLE